MKETIQIVVWTNASPNVAYASGTSSYSILGVTDRLLALYKPFRARQCRNASKPGHGIEYEYDPRAARDFCSTADSHVIDRRC